MKTKALEENIPSATTKEEDEDMVKKKTPPSATSKGEEGRASYWKKTAHQEGKKKKEKKKKEEGVSEGSKQPNKFKNKTRSTTTYEGGPCVGFMIQGELFMTFLSTGNL